MEELVLATVGCRTAITGIIAVRVGTITSSPALRVNKENQLQAERDSRLGVTLPPVKSPSILRPYTSTLRGELVRRSDPGIRKAATLAQMNLGIIDFDTLSMDGQGEGPYSEEMLSTLGQTSSR